MTSDRRAILFAAAAHSGLLNPILSIAGEMSRRNVPDLHFASEEDARPLVDGAGVGSPIAFHSYGAKMVTVGGTMYGAMTRGPRTTAGTVALARVVRDRAVLRTFFQRTLEQIDRLRPSLMVIDNLNVGAIDAACVRRVPYVLSIAFPASGVYLGRLPWSYPTPTSGLPRRLSGGRWLANVAFRLRFQAAMLRCADLTLARERRAYGLANVFADPEGHSRDAVAVLNYSIFGLEYPFAAPAHLHMVGAVIPPQEAAEAGELSDWLDRHESVVYVNMGTLIKLSAAQLRELAEALGRIGPRNQVLWKLPAAQRALLPAELPANVRTIEWVPAHFGVLTHPHVRAVVCHGGNNIFHESVYCGRPMLVMPFWLDCYDLAARAVDAGVGLSLDRPPGFCAAEVATKLLRLLSDDSYRRRSRHWGDRLRQAGGVGRAADIVLRAADLTPGTRLPAVPTGSET
ncbi:glycosyltransferase family 1 protein [Nonomuraea sp. K274]|uniref:Glycosyltransferase family 1 protein n=1 Tax=Nonomuraea cypriaca TaxID=1187855 RepID=A0A931AML2_9ACTN|nr:glycosyltransferase [Nonomuraea cypriaca]MBF8193323.1 glycosyltransferase family 1 protein [Nonomuraea cypriaca]